MAEQKMSIQELADKTKISYPGIWNIYKGNTRYPRESTRKKISEALNQKVPEIIEKQIETEAQVSGHEWTDFSPYDLETIPEAGGVYAFYDITGRPVYVGKSRTNVRRRVKDHQTRFWFKAPLVERGSFLAIEDPNLCNTIEMILIKFMGTHALMNSKGVVRDVED
jgi:transcriptional regulator with XRE-family HTH domain